MSNHTTDDAVYEIALLKESVKLSDKNNWLVVTTERRTKKQSTKIRLPPSANSIASVATDTRGVILTTAEPHGLFVRSAKKGKDVWRAAYSGDVFVEPGTRLPTNLVYVNETTFVVPSSAPGFKNLATKNAKVLLCNVTASPAMLSDAVADRLPLGVASSVRSSGSGVDIYRTDTKIMSVGVQGPLCAQLEFRVHKLTVQGKAWLDDLVSQLQFATLEKDLDLGVLYGPTWSETLTLRPGKYDGAILADFVQSLLHERPVDVTFADGALRFTSRSSSQSLSFQAATNPGHADLAVPSCFSQNDSSVVAVPICRDSGHPLLETCHNCRAVHDSSAVQIFKGETRVQNVYNKFQTAHPRQLPWMSLDRSKGTVYDLSDKAVTHKPVTAGFWPQVTIAYTYVSGRLHKPNVFSDQTTTTIFLLQM